jgi:hypothetical protein
MSFNSKLQGTQGIPKYYPESTVEYLLSLMDQGGVDKGFLISYKRRRCRLRDSQPRLQSG